MDIDVNLALMRALVMTSVVLRRVRNCRRIIIIIIIIIIIRSTTVSTWHEDLPRTENSGGNSWKRLRSSLGHARDDDDK